MSDGQVPGADQNARKKALQADVPFCVALACTSLRYRARNDIDVVLDTRG